MMPEQNRQAVEAVRNRAEEACERLIDRALRPGASHGDALDAITALLTIRRAARVGISRPEFEARLAEVKGVRTIAELNDLEAMFRAWILDVQLSAWSQAARDLAAVEAVLPEALPPA